jgi:hypothetical protein
MEVLLMKTKKIVVFIIILSFIITTFFCSATMVNAASNVGISLSYYYQSIPTSTVLQSPGVVSSGITVYKVAVKATVIGASNFGGRYLTFTDPNTSTVKCTTTSVPITITSTGGSPYTGEATAFFEVRGTTSFSCTAKIDDGTYLGSCTSTITPLEACFYDSNFYVTCYYTADESDYGTVYSVSMAGLTGTYNSNFKAAVRREGSGYSHYGQYVRYTSTVNGVDYFEYGTPVTCTGSPATVGKSIAVDAYNIPRYNPGSGYLKGTVNINVVGRRLAEDRGSAINGWDIDVYTGHGAASANATGYDCTSQWVYYYGNNKW